MRRPRIGAVSYLNTKPLVSGMRVDAQDYELIFDLPSRLADRLSASDLDVGLIPVIEAITNPEYVVVSDACIACHGPVWSVKLMSRVPWPEIQSVAFDEGSRTSCALATVLLQSRFGLTPKRSVLRMDEDWRDTQTDAALIIGDRAMNASDSRFPFTWDLGETWFEWTQKPFVFAVWAAHREADLEHLNQLLSDSRNHGLNRIHEIVGLHGSDYDLTDAECEKYLCEYLHFQLGGEERAGLNLFYQYAKQCNLIPIESKLQFYDCQTIG